MDFHQIVERVAMAKKTSQKSARDLTVPEQQSLFIEHHVEGAIIPQRSRDGYINATLLCQRAEKRFHDYSRSKQTIAFIDELSSKAGIPVLDLVQTIKGGNNRLALGTWVHPKVAINLAQWLSPAFAVQVSDWIFEWMSGDMTRLRPVHVRRYTRNRPKIPYTHFSILDELYLNFLAPLEDRGIIPPDSIMPDISMGMGFCRSLRAQGVDTDSFPTYEHEFIEDGRPTVRAKLYPLQYLSDFREYFNKEWLSKKAETYLKEKFPKAVPYLNKIRRISSK